MISANVHRSQIGIRRDSVSPGALRCSSRGGAAALEATKPHQFSYAEMGTPDSLYPECGSSTSLCRMPVIAGKLLHWDDLQPLLRGASATNVYLRLAEGLQPGDEAMESVTKSSFAEGVIRLF